MHCVARLMKKNTVFLFAPEAFEEDVYVRRDLCVNLNLSTPCSEAISRLKRICVGGILDLLKTALYMPQLNIAEI